MSEVSLEPISPALSLLDQIERCAAGGEAVAVLTRMRGGQWSRALVSRQGQIGGSYIVEPRILSAAVKMLQREVDVAALSATGEVCGPRDEPAVIVEVIKPQVSLVVFGAGHVGQAVSLLGGLLGYRVTVVDDREEFLSRRRLPDARIETLSSDFATAVDKLQMSSTTAVVIVTRGHQYDEICLRSVVRLNLAYVGMIGSKRRIGAILDRLRRDGVPEEALQRVHGPVGLRIGAVTPQEIAVSILAEIIQTLRSRNESGE